MLFSKKETLEDRLVGLLLKAPAEIKELHKRLSKDDKVSLRAVYKSIKALIAEGVLLKAGKRVFVDQEWLKAMREQLSPALPLLSPGERVAYTFTSIEHLDAFWKTLVLPLEEGNQSEFIFIYDPHNFWAYVPERKKSEDSYYAHFAKQKKYGFFVIGGESKADMEFKKIYQNNFLQVDTRAISGLGRRDHITVVGDLVITARMSKQFSVQLDQLYGLQEPIVKILPKILTAYAGSPDVRLIIEHNAAKARRLKKMLSTNFYMPQKEKTPSE